MPAISDTSLRSERPEAADSVTLVVVAAGRSSFNCFYAIE